MTIYEILSLVLSLVAIVVGGVAHYRITKISDTNDIGNLRQTVVGDGNRQAGRDIVS